LKRRPETHGAAVGFLYSLRQLSCPQGDRIGLWGCGWTHWITGRWRRQWPLCNTGRHDAPACTCPYLPVG